MEDQKNDIEDMAHGEEFHAIQRHDLEHRLGTIGWALFLIWIGIAFLGSFEIGISLLGIGVITLGMQIYRAVAKVRVEGFWVVVGILFLVGGFWELFEPDLPLVPVLLIVAGLVLLLSISRRKRQV